MAQNRQSELKPNHPSSSEEEEEDEEVTGSEDEEATGSEDEEVSDSDSEEKQQPKKTLTTAPQSTKKPPAPDLSSSDTEESGSDSDSDSQPKKLTVVDPNVKPISSKPMEREGADIESKSAKNSRSKTSATRPPAKTGKRLATALSTASEKDAKKAKKNTEDDSKKQLFQRLWSEDDEIVILKGMIDYKTEKKGADPVADMGAFHEFIKKSLHVDVSRAQLVDKVRRLKKKFVNNASKEKNGKDRCFSKSHEQKGYELSKLIWGSNSNSNTSGIETKRNPNQKTGNPKGTTTATTSTVALPKSNGVDVEKEASTMEVEKKMDVSRFVQYGRSNGGLVMEEEIVKAGLELVEGSKRKESEEKWKMLKQQELELYLKRLEFLKEQATIVLEAVNSSRT